MKVQGKRTRAREDRKIRHASRAPKICNREVLQPCEWPGKCDLYIRFDGRGTRGERRKDGWSHWDSISFSLIAGTSFSGKRIKIYARNNNIIMHHYLIQPTSLWRLVPYFGLNFFSIVFFLLFFFSLTTRHDKTMKGNSKVEYLLIDNNDYHSSSLVILFSFKAEKWFCTKLFYCLIHIEKRIFLLQVPPSLMTRHEYNRDLCVFDDVITDPAQQCAPQCG